jgi:hypothetical protein
MRGGGAGLLPRGQDVRPGPHAYPRTFAGRSGLARCFRLTGEHERRRLGGEAHGRAGHLCALRSGHDHPGPRVAQQLAEFLAPVHGGHRHRNRAHPQQRTERDDGLRPVGGHQQHSFLRPHTAGTEPGSQLCRPRGKLGVGQRSGRPGYRQMIATARLDLPVDEVTARVERFGRHGPPFARETTEISSGSPATGASAASEPQVSVVQRLALLTSRETMPCGVRTAGIRSPAAGSADLAGDDAVQCQNRTYS